MPTPASPTPERPPLPAALAAVVAARLALATLPLRTLLRLLDRWPMAGGAAPPRAISAEALGRAVAAAGRLVPGTSCLAEALAAQALLRRHGHDAALRLGVGRDEAGRLIAHAWVEREGQILVGGPAGHVARYTPLGAPGPRALPDARGLAGTPGGGPELSPEHRVLLACARTELDAAARARLESLLAGPVDWGRVIDLARLHRVIPLAQRSLGAAGLAGVPAWAREALRSEALAIVRRNLALARELAALLDDLAAEGVAAAPFKGPELALSYYGALGLRQFGDLDIVVAREQFARARQALERRGYEPCGRQDAAGEAAHLRERHDYLLARDDGVMVELQWGVVQRPFAFPLDPARARATVELGGRLYPAFAAEELLVALCVHGAKHQWERLGWACDIAELVRARPDLGWIAVLERARALRVERMVRLGLLLGAWLGAAPPPEIGRWAAADPVAGRLAARVLRAYARAPGAPSRAEEDAPLFYLGMLEGWRDRAGLGLRLAPGLLYPGRLWARYGRGLARPLVRSGTAGR